MAVDIKAAYQILCDLSLPSQRVAGDAHRRYREFRQWKAQDPFSYAACESGTLELVECLYKCQHSRSDNVYMREM